MRHSLHNQRLRAALRYQCLVGMRPLALGPQRVLSDSGAGAICGKSGDVLNPGTVWCSICRKCRKWADSQIPYFLGFDVGQRQSSADLRARVACSPRSPESTPTIFTFPFSMDSFPYVPSVILNAPLIALSTGYAPSALAATPSPISNLLRIQWKLGS